MPSNTWLDRVVGASLSSVGIHAAVMTRVKIRMAVKKKVNLLVIIFSFVSDSELLKGYVSVDVIVTDSEVNL